MHATMETVGLHHTLSRCSMCLVIGLPMPGPNVVNKKEERTPNTPERTMSHTDFYDFKELSAELIENEYKLDNAIDAC